MSPVTATLDTMAPHPLRTGAGPFVVRDQIAESLRDRLERERQLPVAEAVAIASSGATTTGP